MSKSSARWWEEIKSNPAKFDTWLIKQYRGEVTAADRIERFAAEYAPDEKSRKTLSVIASQERQHAAWVLDLLVARGVTPSLEHAEERYWSATLPSIESFETAAAVGAHAEAMRLERIRTIVEDENADIDVRSTFSRILKDEVFHERAFRKLAGSKAMKAVAPSHRKGRELLGLEA